MRLRNLLTLFGNWFLSRGGRAKLGGNDPNREGLSDQLTAIEDLTIRFFSVILVLCVLYALSQLASFGWSELTRTVYVFGILLGVTATGAVIGGLLGFLFGIPRLLQRQGVQPSPQQLAGSNSSSVQRTDQPLQPLNFAPSGRFFAGNTNLEEISDWITKIIVGISLVQSKQIYEGIKDTAAQFKLQAMPNSEGADVVFILIAVSSVIGGFLFFYMETRTRVTLLFGDLEQVENRRTAIEQPKVLNAVLQAPIIGSPDPGAPGGVRATQGMRPDPISEDEKLLHVPYDALQTSDQLAAWASAQARAGNSAAAVRALQDAIARQPGNRDLLLRLADVQQRLGNLQATANLVAEARIKSNDDPILLKRELLVSLYLNPPESFSKAIPIAKKLLADSAEAKDPFVHLWYAAAQGQRFSSLPDPRSTEAQEARQEALDAVKRIVDLARDPSSPSRVALRQIFDPVREGSVPDDNDLEVFKNDPEFQSLIYPDG
jgi:hypothetical protein